MQIDGWLTDTVTVAPFVSRDANGDPTYGAQVARKARVEKKITTVRDAEGTFIDATTILYSVESWGYRDRVWLPGTDVTSANAALTPRMIDEQKDRSGRVVLCRAWL